LIHFEREERRTAFIDIGAAARVRLIIHPRLTLGAVLPHANLDHVINPAITVAGDAAQANRATNNVYHGGWRAGVCGNEDGMVANGCEGGGLD